MTFFAEREPRRSFHDRWRAAVFSCYAPEHKFQPSCGMHIVTNKGETIEIFAASNRYHREGYFERRSCIAKTQQNLSIRSFSRSVESVLDFTYAFGSFRTTSETKHVIHCALTWIIRRLETLSGVVACTVDANSKRGSNANRNDGILLFDAFEVVFSDILICAQSWNDYETEFSIFRSQINCE